MELHVVRLQHPDAEGHDGPLGPEYHKLARLGVLGNHLNGIVSLQLVLHVSHIFVQDQVFTSSQRDGGRNVTNDLNHKDYNARVEPHS